jgi:hypothetical protein
MTTNDDEIDLVDIEEYARAGKHKPRAASRYRFRIDRQHFETEKPVLTGREILAFAGKTPETYLLSQKTRKGAAIQIAADETVDLRDNCVERFMTVPREATEGRELRRQFKLPIEDQEFLSSRDGEWESILDNGTQWVILENFKVPAGYNHRSVRASIRIVANYPDAPLDMVYFNPPLARTDGKPIGTLSTLIIAGEGFQQWSRHRNGANAWRPGEDCLATHCLHAEGWLTDELKKR